MNDLNLGSLNIIMKKDTNKATMAWTGLSVEREPALFLNPYLDKVAEELKGGEIIVEFQSLEYMTSSTVPPIIHFIKKLDINGIKTIINYDKSSKWQTASFKALETISLTMHNIKVEGK